MVYFNKKERDKLAKSIADAIASKCDIDEEGNLYVIGKKGKKLELISAEETAKKESEKDSQVVKQASQMSLQKKEQRLVINMPEWLKDRLIKISKRKGVSMNEIIRQALVEYLLEQEKVE